jgi:hypothetical protein
MLYTGPQYVIYCIHKVLWSRAGFPKTFCSWIPTGCGKKTTVLHILAHTNTQCLDDRYPKLKTFISELILDIYKYIPAAHITTQRMIYLK